MGVAIIIAIAGVTLRIVLKKKQHQRAVAEMEKGRAGAEVSPSRNMQQLPRLATGARCSQMMPNTQQGWGGLGSTETLNEPGAVTKKNPKQLRSSISLPKKVKNRGIQFGRNKYLSTVPELESPISEKNTPELPQQETMEQLMASSDRDTWDQNSQTNQEKTMMKFARSTSPTQEALPSLATRSSESQDAPANNNDQPNRAARSASAGVLMDSIPDGAVFGQVQRDSYRMRNPDTRGRSLSLGAPICPPPSVPVPPLPVRSPNRLITNFNDNDDDDARQGVCISRMSSSSIDSASSSVLVTSPILTRGNDDEALHSPTLEDVVAEDEHASLKIGANRQWDNPRVSGPRPNTSSSTSKVQKPGGSFRGSIIRFSSDSMLTRTLSIGSTGSEGSIRKKRMSIAQIGTANSIVMSRVSSTNSLAGSVGGVQKVITPTRKTKRQNSVSANGSPAERKRAGVLRDISGNANKFSANRESSDSTLNSGRSSCGNPFQWDPTAATLNVPSALKGSPNARKRHRRQNCVRISTLTPQVLGPAARSRSASPANLMQRIKEERESDEILRLVEGSGKENEMQLVVQKRRPNSIRQSSNSTLPGNLRVQTLRASFTPDSPASNANQQTGLKSAASDSNLTVSSITNRKGSEQSDSSSSLFVIPKFPTPSKSRASPAAVNHDVPLPQFSMDYADDNDEQSRFALASSPSSSEPSPVSPLSPGSPTSRISQVSPIAFQLPSSPPTRMSAKKEYDPAWPVINLPMPGEAEYDPASPPTMIWDATDPERSSWFLPFAAGNMFDASHESTNNVVQELSPPCSPKSSPKVPENSPEGETLTSTNASRMMALIPADDINPAPQQGALGLSKIPVLLPPTTSEDPAYQLPEYKPPTAPPHTTAPRPRRVSSTGSPNRIERRRRRRSPEPFLPTIPQSSSPPPPPIIQPLNISPSSGSKTSPKGGPKGPRTAPAKSVLNNISALRRMNSDAEKNTPNRQSRNWARLGREASPNLPFTTPNGEGGVLGREESSNSLFDFDFGTRTSQQYTQSGAEEENDASHGAAMGIAIGDDDERSFSQVLDGALAGFHAEFENLGAGAQEEKEKRVSSVWDDGEQFWKDRESKSMSLEAKCDPNLLSTTPGTQMSSPLAMAANGATPRSLYDADGFLKG